MFSTKLALGARERKRNKSLLEKLKSPLDEFTAAFIFVTNNNNSHTRYIVIPPLPFALARSQ